VTYKGRGSQMPFIAWFFFGIFVFCVYSTVFPGLLKYLVDVVLIRINYGRMMDGLPTIRLQSKERALRENRKLVEAGLDPYFNGYE
jgi:hypothetical protein